MTLRQDYEEAIRAKDTNAADSVSRLHEVATRVETFGLFSDNETKDDLVTSSIRFMAVHYHLAEAYKKSVERELDAGTKLQALQHSLDHYTRFVELVESYQLLPPMVQETVKRARDTDQRLDVSKLESFGGADRRTYKVNMYRRELGAKRLVAQLESQDEEDDELVRELELARITCLVFEALKEAASSDMEMHMLRIKQEQETKVKHEDGGEDERVKQRTEREIDMANARPLLDKHGKVNRPFTIVKSRDQVRKQVFGTGQYLPTMTVEEYLEEEMRQGNILQGGESSRKQESEDEDDHAAQDTKTYEARRWDEFVEANPKGMGNTMNRG